MLAVAATPDGLEDFLGQAVLLQVTGSAGFECTQRILVFGVHAEDEYGQQGLQLLDALEQIDAVRVGQTDIEQQQIPVFGFDKRQGLVPAAGLARDAAVGGLSEKLAQAAAHYGVIIGYQYFEHGGSLFACAGAAPKPWSA